MTSPTPASRRAPPARSATIESTGADWVTRVDAGLTPEEQQIFQDWLSADPRHADAFDRFTETWSVFDRVQERGAASLILDQLAARARRRKARRLQAGVAAGLVLVAGLFYFQWRVSLADRPVRAQPLAQAPAFDPIRKLPDGSIVELNVGAEIAVAYSDTERRVKLLKGEAFFRVEKNKDRPFYVETNGVVVRAVGTAFAVQVQTAAIEVVVQEGAVDVGRTSANGDAVGKQVRVPAGKRVVMLMLRLVPAAKRPDPAGAPAAADVPESLAEPQEMTDEQMDSRLAWRLPRLEFEGMTLGEAVELLNRHNRLQLRIEGAGLEKFRVSGNYRSDNPEGLVRMLVKTEVAVADHQSEDEIVLRPAK